MVSSNIGKSLSSILVNNVKKSSIVEWILNVLNFLLFDYDKYLYKISKEELNYHQKKGVVMISFEINW
jgi:hypothetical protein